jgi:hypothetical protein
MSRPPRDRGRGPPEEEARRSRGGEAGPNTSISSKEAAHTPNWAHIQRAWSATDPAVWECPVTGVDCRELAIAALGAIYDPETLCTAHLRAFYSEAFAWHHQHTELVIRIERGMSLGQIIGLVLAFKGWLRDIPDSEITALLWDLAWQWGDGYAYRPFRDAGGRL